MRIETRRVSYVSFYVDFTSNRIAGRRKNYACERAKCYEDKFLHLTESVSALRGARYRVARKKERISHSTTIGGNVPPCACESIFFSFSLTRTLVPRTTIFSIDRSFLCIVFRSWDYDEKYGNESAKNYTYKMHCSPTKKLTCEFCICTDAKHSSARKK